MRDVADCLATLPVGATNWSIAVHGDFALLPHSARGRRAAGRRVGWLELGLLSLGNGLGRLAVVGVRVVL
ncbi:MAG TPA: hypothetical protein VES62_12250, partial [Thermoleophilaceae bacterium]|nr:hypothetical protein [Thermoleophilaceae bacterium]